MHHKINSVIFALTLFLIMFASIIPLGHSVEWSPEMRLTWTTDIDTFPSITQAGDGRKWVVWCSYRTGNAEIFYKVYNGSSVHPWSPETQLTNDTNSDLTPSVTQALDGSIWVVWASERTGNSEIYYKTYNGTAWSNDEPLITDPGEDQTPFIMQATNGTIWLVWASKPLGELDFDIYYATSSDNGETWSPQILPGTYPGIVDFDPAITEAADGSIWLVWERSGDIFCAVYSETSWSPEEQLTTDPNSDTRPSIAQALDGTIWVVWDSDRNLHDEDIYYKTYDGTWSEDTALIVNTYIDFAPSILQAADGAIWVIWSSTRQDNMDIYYITNSIPDENDVAIFSVIPSPKIVSQGEIVFIEVVSQNKGTQPQTFQVSCYADTIPLGSKTVSLDPGQLNATSFEWNTTTVQPVTYVVTAEASTVAGETYTADNTYVDGTVAVMAHDVSIKNVTTSQTIVHRGYTTMYVYVQVANEGNCTETVAVTAFYNATAIRTMTIVGLAPNSDIQLTFPWSGGVPYGPYVISAKASPVPDELDLTDNSFTDGIVKVTIPGDSNYDRTVNILDVATVSAHWYPGPPVGPLGYDLNVDINQDGEIDIFDAAIVSANWLESW